MGTGGMPRPAHFMTPCFFGKVRSAGKAGEGMTGVRGVDLRGTGLLKSGVPCPPLGGGA